MVDLESQFFQIPDTRCLAKSDWSPGVMTISKRWKSVLRISSLLCWLVLAGTVCCPTLHAQEDQSTNDGPVAVPGQNVKTDILYLKDDQGQLRPVPVDATLKDYLDWLDDQLQSGELDGPEWVINKWDATGQIESSANQSYWIDMQCQMEITVRNSQRWTSIPLQMPEAIITSHSHTPEMDCLLIRSQDEQSDWKILVRGQQSFTVQCQLKVPLISSPSQFRFLLNIPSSSRTDLSFQLPYQENLIPEIRGRGQVKVNPNAKELRTAIQVIGAQDVIDVSWPRILGQQGNQANFNTETLISVARNDNFTTLTAKQTVTLLQGSLSELSIRIPKGYRIDSLQSEIPVQFSADDVDLSLQKLTFEKAITESVRLEWVLSSPVRKFESQIVIDGFEVLNARSQLGQIGLLKTEAWKISPVSTDTRNVYRMNVRDLRLLGSYSLAYRFHAQPYRLVFQVDRIPSQFTSDSLYQIDWQDGNIRLVVDFLLTPQQGVLDSIPLVWPGFQKSDWTIDSIQEYQGEQVVWELYDQNRFQLELSPSISPVRIRLRATQAVGSDDSVSLTLPVVENEQDSHSLCVLKSEEQYDVILESPDLGSIKLATQLDFQNSTWSSELPILPNRQGIFLVQDLLQDFIVRRELRLPEISCQSQIRLLGVQSQTTNDKKQFAQVSQTLLYQIENVPQDLLRINILANPEFLQSNDLMKQATITLNDQPISPVWDQSDQKSPVLVIQPNEPLIGTVKVQVDFQCRLERNTDSQDVVMMSFPILCPSENVQTEILFENLSPFRIDLDQQWITETDSNLAVFNGYETQREFRATVHLLKARESQTQVHQSRIDTWISHSQVTLGMIQLEMTNCPPVVFVESGSKYEILSAYLSSQPDDLQPVSIELLDQSDHTALWLPLTDPGSNSTLIINYKARHLNGLAVVSQIGMNFPHHSLSSRTGVVEWCLHLPAGSYLFQSPRNVQRLYSWSWSGWRFTRQNRGTDSFHDGATSLSQESGLSLGNAYSMEFFGWPQASGFWMVGRTLIVIIGVGLPMICLVGVVGAHPIMMLWRLWLVLVIIGSFALLFPEPVRLLAQPLLLGFVCTLSLSLMMWMYRKAPAEPPLVIIGPRDPDDPQAGSSLLMTGYGVDAEGVTKIHQPATHPLSSHH